MLATGVSKIEQGDRRVDADDLVALALVLDVTPNRLLLVADADAQRVALTADARMSAFAVWRWACGEEAPGKTPWMDSGTLDVDRLQRWNLENRPQHPPEGTLSGLQTEFDEHKVAAAGLRDALDAAVQDGLSLRAVRTWLAMKEITERLQQNDQEG